MKEAISQLEKAGFERISLAESAALEPGKAYYVSIYDRSLAAFRVPQSGFKGFRIITSHIDNPCFMMDKKDKIVNKDKSGKKEI